jgi:hypothetical protein
MRIQFQYFEGCPNSEPSLRNLRDAIDELGLGIAVERVLVASQEEAQGLGFLGSPSISVDGRDLASGEAPRGSAFCCRVYDVDGLRTGLLPKAFILERLRAMALKESGRS